jgi:hypothetical protein
LIWAVDQIVAKAFKKTMDRLGGTSERIAKLDGQLAALTAFGVKADQAVENAGAAMGAIRCELEDTIEAQAKRIAALELRLAEVTGALDILRGRGVPGTLNIKGTFDPDALYLANDIVAFNGSSFVALKDRPGGCPGDGWQLLASSGKRGPRGERGFMGPTGAAAPALKPKWLSFDSEKMALVITMSDATTTTLPLAGVFTGVRVDPADYSIKFSMRDGTELAFSLRELFEQYDNEKCGR